MARNEHKNVMAALKAAMETFPQLRVGQLLGNARWYWNATQNRDDDLFYISDEDLTRAIFSYISDHARRNK